MIALLHPPRLLPITIFALAGLLALKSADLVRAAATSPDASPKVVSTDPAATPASIQPAPSPDPAQAAAVKQAGVSNYIVKPFNAETLRDKIEKVLGHD